MNEVERKRWVAVSKLKTLISDLSLPEEDIWSKIGKNTRYEIRRSEREGIITEHFSSEEITPELFDTFEKTYNEMYQSKGIKTVFDRALVNQYIKNDMIVFSAASYESKPLVFHSYIVDENNARFFHSCSTFRSEPEMAALIGRMNRYLHWKDYVWLKDIGIKEYDWGGINDSYSTDPSNITKFKMSFGGVPEARYNYMIANSMLGKIAFLYFRKKME